MRHLLLVASLFFAAAVTGQSYYKDISVNKVTITSADQTIVAYTEPVKGEVNRDPAKSFFWYSGNQINRTQGGFSGKLLNGPYAVYYPGKNLKEQGQFKNGLQQGEWRSWYMNGKLKEISRWRNGVKAGRFEEFNEQGLISRSGRYGGGELQGKVRIYSSKDSSSSIIYKDGLVQTKPAKKRNAWDVLSNAGRGVKRFVSKLLNPKNKTERRKMPSSTRKNKGVTPK
jgi:hypothetical protein